MKFKKTTDDLFKSVTHDDLAATLGASVASIRQARLGDDAKARRSPPIGWEKGVLKLAEAKAKHFESLANRLRRHIQSKSDAQRPDLVVPGSPK